MDGGDWSDHTIGLFDKQPIPVCLMHFATSRRKPWVRGRDFSRVFRMDGLALMRSADASLARAHSFFGRPAGQCRYSRRNRFLLLPFYRSTVVHAATSRRNHEALSFSTHTGLSCLVPAFIDRQQPQCAHKSHCAEWGLPPKRTSPPPSVPSAKGGIRILHLSHLLRSGPPMTAVRYSYPIRLFDCWRSISSASIGTPRLQECTPCATQSFKVSMISSGVAPAARAPLM